MGVSVDCALIIVLAVSDHGPAPIADSDRQASYWTVYVRDPINQIIKWARNRVGKGYSDEHAERNAAARVLRNPTSQLVLRCVSICVIVIETICMQRLISVCVYHQLRLLEPQPNERAVGVLISWAERQRSNARSMYSMWRSLANRVNSESTGRLTAI